MTISLNTGLTAVGTTASTLATTRYDVSEVFRVKSEKPDEVVLTDITAPLDRPCSAKIGSQEISNIYKGTGIVPAHQSASTKGRRIICGLRAIAKKTDDADATYEVHLPFSVDIVVKTAQDELITPALLLEAVGRCVGLMQDETTGDRLAEQLRGAIDPT
jgi:hypothetical protein